jgi:Taurine catabolism dioxygenase TauD, TfdA family
VWAVECQLEGNSAIEAVVAPLLVCTWLGAIFLLDRWVLGKRSAIDPSLGIGGEGHFMDNVTTPFVVRRIAGAIGAEIRGVKLLPDGVIAELRRLWLEHLVLFFHDQELTPQELAAVARRFGEVVYYPFLKGLDEAPEVIQVAKLAWISTERN